MVLVPETYNCAIHKLITGFIKTFIYGLLQAVWSGSRPQVESVRGRSCSLNPVSVSRMACVTMFGNNRRGKHPMLLMQVE